MLKARIRPVGGGFYQTDGILVKYGGIVGMMNGTAYLRNGYVNWFLSSARTDLGELRMSKEIVELQKVSLVGMSEGFNTIFQREGETMETTHFIGFFTTLTPFPCSLIWLY